MRYGLASIFIVLVVLVATALPGAASPAAVTYYVSSSTGNDSDDGLSEANAFATIAKVNALNLQPGDRVLFKCGDVWHAEQLILSKSGTELAPIVFQLVPRGLRQQTEPLRLAFDRRLGVRFGQRLSRRSLNHRFSAGPQSTLSQRPASDVGTLAQSECAQRRLFVCRCAQRGRQSDHRQRITHRYAPIDWSGAIVHIKNIRWSMLDRQVTGTSGHTLTLNHGLLVFDLRLGQLRGLGLLHQQPSRHARSRRRVVLQRDNPTRLSVLHQRRAEQYRRLRHSRRSRHAAARRPDVEQRRGHRLRDRRQPGDQELVQSRHRHAGRHERRHLSSPHRAQRDDQRRGQRRREPEQLAGTTVEWPQGSARRRSSDVHQQRHRRRECLRHHRLLRRLHV